MSSYYLCPLLAQVHGSRLRLPQVSPADSGEYVCRVESEAGPKEASIVVSVLHSTHPGQGPGEERHALSFLLRNQGRSRQARTLCCLLGE